MSAQTFRSDRIARHRERGQALLAAVLLLAIVAGGASLLVALGLRADAVAQARTAADAAALAGAVDGRDAAEQVAHANGARLVRFERDGAEAQVTVERRGATATARARDQLAHLTGGDARAGATGLDPRLLAALARAEALLGEQVPITSGWRSSEAQQRLWDQRASNPYPVAPPGTSMHERGLAVDVPLAFVPRLRGVAHAVGLCFPLPTTDPVHFELCPAARR